jgi:hypothetical protein
MKSFKFVTFALLPALFMNPFALAQPCDHERNEYVEWNDRCEQLSASSQVAGVAGGIFAICTFGASMIPCAAAAAAASNACRIRDEKKINLDNCEANQRALDAQAKAAAAAATARRDRIKQINADFANRSSQLIQRYAQMVQDFFDNYSRDGWNTEDPESQELLRTTREKIERERDQKLKQLEAERKQTVQNA